MGTAPTFQQILAEKMQASGLQHPTHNGFDPKVPSQDPAHLAYLLGQLETTVFRPSTSKIYPSRPKPPPPPHILTGVQVTARDYFAVQGVELSPAFTQRELKRAFRTLALRFHPDMNKGASGAFIELKKHYEMLHQLFR